MRVEEASKSSNGMWLGVTSGWRRCGLGVRLLRRLKRLLLKLGNLVILNLETSAFKGERDARR